MTTVLLIGYYGFQNAGDEWLLNQSIRWVRDHYPDAHIQISLPKTAPNYVGFTSVDRWSIRALARAINQSDHVVFGGGGLFQDSSSRRSFLYYLAILWRATKTTKSVTLLAQGIGPIRSPRLGRWLANLLSHANVTVSVRDTCSQEALGALGVTRSYLVSDLVFYKGKMTTPKVATNIGISLRPMDMPPSLKEVLSKLLNKIVSPKKLLAMHPKWDIPFTRHIFQDQTLSLSDMNTIGLDGELPLKGMITMRYHAAAYAALHGIPFLALASDEKLISLAKDCGQPFLDLRSPRATQDLPSIWNDFAKQRTHYQTELIRLVQNPLERAKGLIG
ncbi:hypothetical protein HOH87_07535 [bacterium]|nr:hypothetical protein [bacterium]